MLGLVVFGSRTWICTIAAPALVASTAELAICSGVTGTAGLRPGVSADPVTAQEIMIFRCIVERLSPIRVACRSVSAESYREMTGQAQRGDHQDRRLV